MAATPGKAPVKMRAPHAGCRQRQRPTHTRNDTAAPTAGKSVRDRTYRLRREVETCRQRGQGAWFGPRAVTVQPASFRSTVVPVNSGDCGNNSRPDMDLGIVHRI